LRVSAVTVAGVFVLTLALVALDVVAVGPSSPGAAVFSSMIAGLLTLVTVTLTINQLILSRVFGTPRTLSDELDGNRKFRDRIEELVGRQSLPNQPGKVLPIIGEEMGEKATNFRAAAAAAGAGDERIEGLPEIEALAETLREINPDEMSTVAVIERLLGSRYARCIATVDRLREADRLSGDEQSDLDAIDDLLEGFAIMRQYYKTLALQQMLARLSRLVTYFGFVSILVAFYLTLVYRTNGSPAVDPRYLPWLVSAGAAVTLSPLVVFLAYVLRIATVSRYTLSVGPFVSPRE
jgi:hypothetical protein